ncbi:universal stress protein [Halarchaeum sp. P4]|uniref:universal stress protein n=1 Tax=Halarchaeum sp. P4 TaxID=3421639 RepID=UPI003EBFB558
MTDHVLIPTDGSRGSELAVPHAVEYAARHDATLHVLYVVDAQFAQNEQARTTLQRRGRDAVGRIERQAIERGVAVETELREGTPFTEILDAVDDYDADVVVMGTHGRAGLDRLLVGSVTERVVRGADVPVLTVGGPGGTETAPPYENVLVPTDGSDAATAALDAATDFALAYGATLHLLHVVDLTAVAPDVQTAFNVDVLQQAGEKIVADAAERARDAGIEDVVTAVEPGTPVDVVRTYIDDHDVDFVAMGAHGRQSLERFLVGSTTDRVVRSTDLPVLTVRTE